MTDSVTTERLSEIQRSIVDALDRGDGEDHPCIDMMWLEIVAIVNELMGLRRAAERTADAATESR